MAKGTIGGEISIVGLEEGITRIEKKMTNLSKSFDRNSQDVINAFKNISEKGVTQLLEKLNTLNTALDKIATNKNGNLSNIGAGAGRSIDEIAKLTDALERLKTVNSLKLKTERAKRDYAKEANNIKEVVVQEKERTRELERQNKINIALNNKRLSVGKKSESNVIRQEMNLEKQKERQLIEADAKDKARHKDRMVRLRQELKEIDRLAKAYKKMPTTISTKAAGGLIGQSLNATSINQRITAIHNLKNALKDLDTTTEKGKRTEERLTKELNRQTTELRKQGVNLDDVKNKKKSLMNISDQLRRNLALVFSVSAIQGYIQKLASVRAEFELNQRALEAILQNKEKANEIWNQTVQLALKSPFRVKELVSYTKQLAAYRIESDKLFETNKMLADVSAGLGVDMQRLILAYGQVRAAEYLRGTELRQFTEAGIPMLDELAKYFSEMEGRAVSTANVFQRISKRMVKFGDVAEVFNRITSAGGVFYEMQEKQANTLYGQISNLHDALDLMMNDIGKQNDGILKGSVSALRAIVDNWEEVWIRIQQVAAALLIVNARAIAVRFLATQTGGAAAAAFRATNAYSSLGQVFMAIITRIANTRLAFSRFFATLKNGATTLKTTSIDLKAIGTFLSSGLLKGINLVRAGFNALKVTLSSFLPFLVITAVFELYNALTASSRAAERLSESLSAVDLELSKDLETSISAYERLARVVSETNRSYTEREEAMQELKRTFEDVLPSIYLERDAILEMAGNYDKVTESLRLYYGEKAKAQKTEKLDEHYQKGFSTDIKESWDINAINKDIGGILENEYLKVLSSVVEKGKEAAKNGILWDKDKLKQELADALAMYYGFSDEVKAKLNENLDAWKISHNLGDIVDDLKKYSADFSTIGGLATTTKTEEAKINVVSKIRKEYEEYKKTLSDINTLYAKYNTLQKKAEKEGVEIPEQDAKEIEKQLETAYAKINVTIPINGDFSGVSKNAIAMQDELDRVATQMRTSFSNNMLVVANNIHNAANGIYTMRQDLAGMANIPMPEMLSNIQILTPEMQNLNTAIQESVYRLEGAGSFSIPPFFTYLPNATKDATEFGGTYIKMVEDVVNESDKQVNTAYQQFINNIIKEVADANGISLSMLDDLVANGEDTTESIKTKYKALYEELSEKHLQAKKILAENPLLTPVGVYSMQFGAGTTQEDVEKQLNAYKEVITKAGLSDILNNKKTKKQDTSAKNLAKVLEDMYKSYQDFNKKFDKGDASERVKKNWTEAFEAAKNKVKGFNLELKDFDFTSIEGLTAALEKLEKTKQGKKIAADIKQTLSGLTDDRDIEVEEKREELRDREIDQMFELYDIYKDLEKLGIDKKAAKGLFGIDATSLDEMRSKLEQMKAAGQFTGTDDEKAYQKYLDKITEMENKAQQERLKTYLKYSRDAMTDRAKIKFEELQKLAEIEKTFAIKEGDTEEVKEIKNTQRTAAIEAVQKESAQQTNKSLWEDFQKSDIFLSVFQDAENASVTMMEHVLAKLRGFKAEWANMPLESVKQITQKMTELENKLIEAQNPFKALREINKKIQEELTVTTTGADGKEVKTTISKEKLESDATAAQSQIDINNTEIAQLGVINELLTEGKLINSEQQAIYQNLTGDTDVNLDTIKDEVKARKDANKNLQETVDKNNKVNNLQNQGKKALLKQADAIRQCNKMANDLYGAFAEIWEVAGGDEVTKMFADMGMSIATSVLDTIALQMQLSGATVAATGFGAAMNTAMGIIGWIVLAVQIIAKVLSTVFAAHDKGLQEDIEKIDEEINVLQKSLEKLEEQLETVYSSTNLVSTMRKANSNIEQQIAKRRQQIELEKEKKSEDEDQIKAWEDEIVELQEKAVEMRKEMVESLGGTYDIRSFAREFADAWIQSFEETGDGLKGLQDNFKEFMKNVLLEQAVMKGLGNIMQPVTDAINTALENDYQVDKLELNKIEKAAEDAMLQGNIFMKSLFGDGGIFSDYVNDTSSSLSGLQEGIQGVTEETAQIIEAYLNSIRFYIAQDNQNLAKLTQFFTGGEDIENPMLSQLKIIATQTSAIRMVFDSIVRSGHSQGGFGVKVFID